MKKNSEKVSIIVPIYKVEKYLRKCIDSLIDQSYENIEILLVDDGSPDNCGKICDEYALKDKRIKVIHKENGGYGSVLEYGINNIDSKYFLICDSDDWLEKDAIKILHSAMIDKDVDLVCGEKFLVYNNNSRKQICNSVDKNYEIKSDKVYTDLSNFVFLSGTPHSKLYKTEYAKGIKFPHKVNNTDGILYYMYLNTIKKAVYINTPLSNYFFDRPDNSTTESSQMTPRAINSALTMVESLNEQLDNKTKIYPLINVWLFFWLCELLGKFPKASSPELKNFKKRLKKLLNREKKFRKYIYNYFDLCSKSRIYSLCKKFVYSLLMTKLFFNLGEIGYKKFSSRRV